MKVADSLNVAISALVSKPSALFPFYLLGTAVTMVARVIPVLAAALAYLLLLSQGRIAAAREDLQGLDLDAMTEELEDLQALLEGEPEEAEMEQAIAEMEAVPQLVEGLSHLVTPEVVVLALLGLLGFALVAVLLGAVVVAGQIHVVYSLLIGGEPIPDGVAGLVDDGTTFVGIRVLELLVQLALAVVFVALVATVAAAAGGPAAVLSGLFFGLFWVLAALFVRAIFVFAPQSIVVDGTGVTGSIRESVGFVRRRPEAFAAYVLIFLGVSGGVISLSSLFAFVNISRITALVIVFVVTPALHLVKTAIYADESAVTMPLYGDRSDPPVATRLREELRRGLSRTWKFTVRTPGLLAVSFGAFGLGGVAGYLAIRDVALSMTPPDAAAEVFGVFPIDAFVQIAANNWLVAVAQSYAGFAFGIPTAVNLLFNGFIVGLLAGIESDPVALAALIVPHALIELPAIGVSGALGFHLGLVGWRRFRGQLTDRDVASEIERAYHVLVGLAIVLIVAAFVEAFVTPQVAELVV